MKHAFNNISLICILVFIIPLFSSSLVLLNQQQKQQSITQTTPVFPKIDEEIFNPSNWIVRGGYWDFSDKIIFSQGYRGGNTAYYRKRNFKNFTFEIKMMKISEDGPFGMVFRYDVSNDEGYIFGLHPHGGYHVSKFNGPGSIYLERGASAFINEEMNAWNTLKIVVTGDRFHCYINGSLIKSVRDNTYSVGKVGLFNSGDPRQIAKFEVIALLEH